MATRDILGKASFNNSSRFSSQFILDRCQTSNIPARFRKTFDEAGFYQITTTSHNDGNRVCRILYDLCHGDSPSDDDIRLRANKVGCNCGKTMVIAFCIVISDDNILSFLVTEFTKPFWNALIRLSIEDGEPATRTPISGFFGGCCASARWTETTAKLASNRTMLFIVIPTLFTAVHCRLSRTFSLLAAHRIWHSWQLPG